MMVSFTELRFGVPTQKGEKFNVARVHNDLGAQWMCTKIADPQVPHRYYLSCTKPHSARLRCMLRHRRHVLLGLSAKVGNVQVSRQKNVLGDEGQKRRPHGALAQTTILGWTVLPISQLTVLVLPLTTNMASLAVVTRQVPKTPALEMGRFVLPHSAVPGSMERPMPVIISTFPSARLTNRISSLVEELAQRS